jgi:hypothetical protein
MASRYILSRRPSCLLENPAFPWGGGGSDQEHIASVEHRIRGLKFALSSKDLDGVAPSHALAVPCVDLRMAERYARALAIYTHDLDWSGSRAVIRSPQEERVVTSAVQLNTGPRQQIDAQPRSQCPLSPAGHRGASRGGA